MSKRSRRRKPTRHPAKRAARAGRRDAARPGGRGERVSLGRQVVREAAGLTAAMDAELWASGLLGALWNRRFDLEPADLSRGYAIVLGEPLLAEIAELGGRGARIALQVIAVVDDGELGMRAAELARGLGDVPLPGWVGDVGQAEIVAAAVLHEDLFEDGSTVFIEARHPDGSQHAVGVYIDNNLGGLATDILLADSIADVERVMREHPPPDGELTLTTVTAGVAAGQIHAAIELTDMTFGLDVGEDFADLRCAAIMLGDGVRAYEPVGERSPVTQEARDRLLGEFLSSPDGAGIAPDSDEAFVVVLAIDFCSDYTDGQPLRWSPALVELFMVGWLRRKVLNAEELIDTVPGTLERWVRFAGRKTGKPAWAVEATVEAIGHWHREIRNALDGPTVSGPTRQLFKAALQAGVNLRNKAELAAFIAAWNEHPPEA